MLTEVQRAELRQSIVEASTHRQARVMLDAVRQLMRQTSKPAVDASFCATGLARLGDTLITDGGLRPLKAFVLRSVTIEPTLPLLRVEAALQGFAIELQLGEYGSYLDDAVNREGPVARFGPNLVVLVFELEDVAGDLADLIAAGKGVAAFERIDEATALLGQMLRGLRSFSKARLLLQGFVVPDRSAAGDVGDANLSSSLPRAVAELNARLAALCREIPDCVFFDVDQVAGRFGRAAWRDERLFLATRLPVSAVAHMPYAQGLIRSAAAMFRVPRKVLCTDLDNTFWGGVLGEEGVGGIATGGAFPGNAYFEYQRYLKRLAARGVLLAVVSKNNPADVEEAFLQRRADLAITLDEFVGKKIGWGDKVTALRELAAELSLGLDSFVFVDDHPVECEAMRQMLPEVATVCLPADQPWRFVELLSAEPFFDAVRITEADTQRGDEYRAQKKRAELEGSVGSREEFLSSLGIVCTFLPVKQAPLARAVQLLGKTNQFNLTTRRHGAAEVECFASEGVALAVRVRDRFGDAGVVGLALVGFEENGRIWRIDSFLLSCRVIGRGIETAMLAELLARANAGHVERLVGEYVPSTKNGLCAQFYPGHGFKSRPPAASGQDQTVVHYERDLEAWDLSGPSWITVEYLQEDRQERDSVSSQLAS